METDVAYHEAGHAAMAYWLGIPVRSADIVGDEAAAGRVLTRGSDRWILEMDTSYEQMPAWARRRVESQIMASWAGPMAEYRHVSPEAVAMPPPQVLSKGSVDEHGLIRTGSDLDLIGRVTVHLVVDDRERIAYNDWLCIRAWNTLKQPLVWRYVEAVAEALRHHQRLSGPAIRAVCKTTRDQLFRPSSPGRP